MTRPTLSLVSRTRDEEGSALVAAVMVGFIGISLGLVVVAQSIDVSRDSGRDRQRTAQVQAAEGGVDRAYYALQTGAAPCAPTTTNVQSRPDTTSVTTSVRYFSATGAEFACPTAATGTPSRALITATATSVNSIGSGVATRRTMESEVVLGPSSAGKGYAIYSYSQFSVPNSFDLSGDGVSSPDIYARGGFNCTNSAEMDGNVFSARGGAQLANSCSIAGNLSVRDAINVTNTSRVGGTAFSSRGGLQQSNSASVGRDVILKGSYGGDRSKVAGVIRENETGLADPLDQPLPYIGYDSAAWSASGYTIRNVGSNCNTIKTEMTQMTTPTLFYGTCSLNFSGNNKDLKLKTDVALFLTGGMNVANNFGLASSDTAQTRKLFIISPAGTGAKPAGWTPDSCSGGGLNFGNQTDIDRSVNVFLYTCGGIQAANSSTFYGQLYGKQVTVANSYTMTFVGLPPVGVDLGGAPALPGYRVEVVYKRETQNPV